jgi:tetratricopeptide (TPR) repeat protein
MTKRRSVLILIFGLILSGPVSAERALAEKPVESSEAFLAFEREVSVSKQFEAEIQTWAQDGDSGLVSEKVADLGSSDTWLAQSNTIRGRPVRKATPQPGAAQHQVKQKYLARARQLATSGQYNEASKLLFQMARNPMFVQESAQLKYVLGLMLFQLKLNQAAAFVFYDVVRQESKSNAKSKYVKQSLEKLSLAADALNSDVLLKYAIEKIDENDFPADRRDLLYYRKGELQMTEKKFKEAAQFFARVQPGSPYYIRAKYDLGLALSEAKDLNPALATFEELEEYTAKAGVTDPNRVNAIMGKARVEYQKQDWDASIDSYREVPRDTEQWHESLFESSWAMLRSARFRSALSNFHSLHSPYYEDFYQPESLLLRAIVYLYICRYGEGTKVLDLFEHMYGPVQKSIRSALMADRDPMIYFKEVTRVSENFDSLKAKKSGRSVLQLPFLVSRQILKEGDVRKSMAYLQRLLVERRRTMTQISTWQMSGVGKYAQKVVDRRIEATQAYIGKLVRRHLIILQADLRDLFEQDGFLRFEMTNGKKESLKKEMAGKEVHRQIDQDTARDFFVQNGYDYWPFKGEYWLDEIGNYHYVGVQACE